ncbi:MAG: hypothetical protein LQ340_003896 [Diploschistes diacapsis]|nr:MAG: hypothetical protein LQ340_003896 [Diploschistes diacapsis]
MPLRRTAEPGLAAALSVADVESNDQDQYQFAHDPSGEEDLTDDSDGDSSVILLPPVPHSNTNSIVGPTVKMSSSSSQDTHSTHETAATAITQPTLGPLQEKGLGQETDEYEPIDEDDPQNFDLTAPADEGHSGHAAYSLEARSEQLFSKEHLELIFSEPSLLLKFTNHLSKHRPQAVPILIYYLDALKALRAIAYANAVSEGLEPLGGHDFTRHAPQLSKNLALEEKAAQAFDVLVREELPAFITYRYVSIVGLSIHRRIMGTLAPHLREASEGLAEVFCLTDVSRPDNPIVFSSEGGVNLCSTESQQRADRVCRIPPHDTVRPELCYWKELSLRAGSKDE